MKATGERNVFKRGKGGVYYVRRRIPKPLLTAYPQGKTEIVRSLGTADPRTARSKAILELAALSASSPPSAPRSTSAAPPSIP